MPKPIKSIGPWHHMVFLQVGGLVGIGFPSDVQLLTVSWSGRGLFDLRTCSRTSRDTDPIGLHCLAADHQSALGIGEFAGQMIPIVGLWGGSGCTQTSDGWSLKTKTAWGNVMSFSFTDPNGQKVIPLRVMAETEYRAISFSPSGNFLLLASSSDVQVLQQS